MNDSSKLFPLFLKQLKPTKMQVFVSGGLAFIVLAIVQSDALLKRLGFNSSTYAEGGKALKDRLDIVLGSQLASNVVLITFWATVGLITYLIVWSVLNVITDLRNEVTLETAYVNRGHWKGVWETIALKAVALALLVGFMATFRYTFSLWITLTTPVATQPFGQTMLMPIIAWLGLSLQIYIIILLVILVVTPWYRASPFTD
jgi:hypothetical protein